MCDKSDLQQKPLANWFKHDPIESDSEMQPILAAAAEEARAELLAAGKISDGGTRAGFGTSSNGYSEKSTRLSGSRQPT